MSVAKPPDIHDVARHAGVSISTVSRTLNHPELVRADTRNKIQDAIEATGYIRNRAASSIHKCRSGTIGLLAPTIDNSIFSNLIQGFSETLNDHNFTMLISTHGYDLDLEYSQLRNMLELRVDAIALVGLEHSERCYTMLTGRRTPAVAMWNYDPQSLISCVGADNRIAGRLAAEHIVELGHSRIAIMFPPVSGNDRARFRLEGTQEVLNEQRIELPGPWNLTAKYDISQAKNAALSLLDHADRPSAIIAGNDIIARGAISAAFHLGISVPDGLSVIGIGDFAGSAEGIPPLTTVNLDAGKVGKDAAEFLINDQLKMPTESIIRKPVEPRLIIRETTHPADSV